MDGIVKLDLPMDRLKKGIEIVAFLADTAIFTSRSEARKMIQNGGVSVNRKKADLHTSLNHSDLLFDQYLLVQKGKKNYYLIKAV